ncbi:50S ribosomal protein L25 [Candidatus Peregrinibacteria bacterium]|nr:50S ribosomal protein L25 [Candidatus Peregrinibacteria bacterium]
MEKITLNVTEGVYDSAKAARNAGRIPMAYYGKGVENHGFSADYQEFRRAYEKGGHSTIMYFVNEKGEEFPILIQDIQYDPVSDQIIHADLLAINMDQPITTAVPLVLTGVAPAVRELGGILVQNKNNVQVECLPGNLVHEIKVDISSLVDFHSSITIGDIKVPDTIEILDAPDINVATVSAPKEAEEEMPAKVEGVEGVEGAEEGEKKEGEAAEGGEEKKEG